MPHNEISHYQHLILDFVRDAGLVALQLIDCSAPSLKPDSSVITQADHAISALAHGRLDPLIRSGNHILIDEEDPQRGAYLDKELLERVPFFWSIDPVDGTRAYANRMPHYGISIGLLKQGFPWMGAVYFPSLRELFYCDGDDAYFIRDPFTPSEKRVAIVPIDEDISSRSVFIATDEILTRFHWQEKDCRVMVFASAVTEFCWPAIGRGAGSLSMVHLWDMAGAWPIFQRAGLQLRALHSGQVLDRISVDLFDRETQPWRLKEYYILSSEKNYPLFKDRLHKR